MVVSTRKDVLTSFSRQLLCFALLLLAQLGLSLPAAYALSPSCSTLSALSTTNYTQDFAASSFAAGETVIVTFTDDGQDTSGLPLLADHVLVEPESYGNGYNGIYYSSDRVGGLHTVTVSSAQLTSTGLLLIISTGQHIGTVNITCSAPVAAPTVGSVSATVAANSSSTALPLSITGTASTVAVSSAPLHGSTTISGTSILYTPASGYAGTDSLSYTASNSGGTSAAAIVTITVTPPAPTVANVSASVVANSSNNPVTLAITGAASSVAVETAPSHGTATVSGTTILYTPADGYTGTDSFTYTATNSGGTSSAAAANITVTAPAVVPTVTNISAAVAANSDGNTLTLAITGTATSVAVVSPPSHGSVRVLATSMFYTPLAGFSGTDSFTYTATNASGTSGIATASITVVAEPLSLAPAAGALPAGIASKAYSQTFSTGGGTASSTFIASALPAGLSMSAQGVLSGTPSAAGSYSFTVTATDSAAATVSATYTLTIAAAPQDSPPTAVNRAVTVNAGQAIVINLSEGATGASATAAALLIKPEAAQGTATISNNVYLNFAAAAQANGTLTLQYTLSNAFGTSGAATLTIKIIGRPDPSQDQQVIGLVNVQSQSAVQFASAQISNFNRRLEHVHNEADRQSRLFDVNISVPQSSRNQEMPTGAPTHRNSSEVARRGEPAVADGERDRVDSALAIWTGGYVNFVNSDRDQLRLDHTTVGISVGADYRFTPELVAGVGLGMGHDVSDVGTAGTKSKGNAASMAAYASYHTGPVYVDSLLGYSQLNFDSRRYVTDTTGYADGSRSGQQAFGAVSSGYEFQLQNLMLAPYGRVQFSATSLRHYAETGAGIYNLAYANQRVNTLAAVLGLRGQYGVPMSWGALRLTSRVEYSDAVRRDSVAKLGYADLADDTYTVNVLGLEQNKLSVEAGVEFMLHQGWTIGLSYQGARSTDGGTRENALLFRAGWRY